MMKINFKEIWEGMFPAVDEEGYDDQMGQISETPYEESYYNETEDIEEPVAHNSYAEAEPVAAPVVTQYAPQSRTNLVMLSPYDIRSSQTVCDHIRRGDIVLCSISNFTDKSQRVVDYISGGVYALGGHLEPTPTKTTFVCTPNSVSLIVEDSEESKRVSAL